MKLFYATHISRGTSNDIVKLTDVYTIYKDWYINTFDKYNCLSRNDFKVRLDTDLGNVVKNGWSHYILQQ
jgi:hypothetical protein